MNFKNLLKLVDKIPFTYKTSFLLFIITGGMISIILLSQVSIYTLKNDFDFLLEKRTKPIIKLESIKDTFTINLYDTLADIRNKNLSVNQSRDVILLAQQLIHKNWTSYKNTNIHSDYKAYFITKIMKDLLLPQTMPEDKRLKTSIIRNIDKKIILINRKVNHIYILFKEKKEKKAIQLINKLYYDINSINIYITNLTDYDLNLAIKEKLNTQKVFNTLSLILNISILFVFLFSILLTIIITNNFKRTHHLLKLVQKRFLTYKQELLKEIQKNKEKEALLSQQSKMAAMGEMIANIAHQWRHPLSSIMMIVQSFQTKMSLGKLNAEFVDRKVEDAMLLSNNMSNTLE
ncbi:MAG: HAMP domain-containing histidine kinase, partial [Campylobacteraceae bacterium]|nr:HAMP domain-containing histidine kinase [Campylobacteraceae bacterium]